MFKNVYPSPKTMKFVIEHMEEELSEWCIAEYSHISSIVGKSHVVFTNVAAADIKRLQPSGEATAKKASEFHLKRACILDPKAKAMLSKKDAQEFDYFIFGGILGNNPAEGRTSILTKVMDIPTRSLGPKQFSTDTAVYVAKKLLEGTLLKDIHFVEEVEIQIDDGESMILPFPYVVENGKLIISDRLIQHISKGDF
jgi:ribosome biogenesis SPOUT family RNA methylase Rps3